MLRYLSIGPRHFARRPIMPHSRLNWEFYFALKGHCGVILESGEKLPLRERHLWLFPPHHVHGWHGDRQGCEVAVFHFGSVPRQLAEAMQPGKILERAISEAECRQVEAIAHAAEPDFHVRTTLSELRFERCLLDLTLLALGETEGSTREIPNSAMREKVEEAMLWFRRNLQQRPDMEQVAAAVHVSSSHLRRMFIAVLHESPRAALRKIQVEMAMRLLSDSDLKIESVAAEAGFSSARDFSRVFSVGQGCSPSEWQRRLQPPYAE